MVLPLVAAILFASLTLRHILTISSKSRQICRSESLLAQQRAQKSMQKLLKLNTRAQELQKSYLLAQKKLQMALLSANKPAAIAAQARITAINLQKGALQIRQEQIKFLNSSQQKLHQTKGVSKIKNVWGDKFLKISVGNLDYNSIPFALEKAASYLAPPYRESPSFESQQKNYYRWKIKVEMHLPFIKENTWIFAQSCAASLKSSKHEPRLVEDNALLR